MSETAGPTATDLDAREALLLTGTPEEVLARLVAGDPLGLRDRVAAALRERALFLDAERVHVTLCALVAYRATGWRGRPNLARWLRARLDEALALAREELGDGPSAVPDAIDLVARPLGLDAPALRRGCAALNRQPRVDRRAFLRVAVAREDPEAAARSLGLSVPELVRRVQRARDALLAPVPAPTSLPETRP